MLQHLTDDGYLSHTCGTCATRQTVHLSHEDVRFHAAPLGPKEARTVGLPACADCGAKTFLKVDFTPEELMASNMIDRQGVPTASHAAAQRHIKLAQLMEDMGKVTPLVPAPEPASPEAVRVEVSHQALLDALQAEGIPATSLADFATWLKAAWEARGMTPETLVLGQDGGSAFGALED